MPCRDWDQGTYVEIDRPSTVNKLCEAYRLISLKGYMHLISNEGQQWYKAHKKEDEARLAAEKEQLELKKKRDYILSKLTTEEKKILGIK